MHNQYNRYSIKFGKEVLFTDYYNKAEERLGPEIEQKVDMRREPRNGDSSVPRVCFCTSWCYNILCKWVWSLAFTEYI